MWINRTEIAKHREISKSVREDKINPFIDDALLEDLQPLLGESFFNLVDDDLESHAVLLDGGTYESNGKTFKHPGLKKVLSLFTYARYIMFGSYTDTSFGFVEKSGQDSKPVGDVHKRAIYTENRKTALTYFRQVELFLDRTNYEGWRTGNCAAPIRSGIRISKIS